MSKKRGGGPTLYEAKEKKEQQVLTDLKKRPDVAAILGEFPDAVIEKVKPLSSTEEEIEEKDSEESA